MTKEESLRAELKREFARITKESVNVSYELSRLSNKYLAIYRQNQALTALKDDVILINAVISQIDNDSARDHTEERLCNTE